MSYVAPTSNRLEQLLGRQPDPVERMREPTCEACRQRIVFVQMAKSGKWMPCAPEWRYGDGHRTLVVLDEELHGHVVVKADERYRGREPHFGTCPVRLAERAVGRKQQDGAESNPTPHLRRVK